MSAYGWIDGSGDAWASDPDMYANVRSGLTKRHQTTRCSICISCSPEEALQKQCGTLRPYLDLIRK